MENTGDFQFDYKRHQNWIYQTAMSTENERP